MPSDIGYQVRKIVTVVFSAVGIILGIPECQPYFWTVFRFTLGIFSCALYLRLQDIMLLIALPFFYLFALGMNHIVGLSSYNLILSFPFLLNACIITSAVVINSTPHWRTSPTVLVATAIITEDPNFVNAPMFAMYAMQHAISWTASSLKDLSYPIQILIQAICAAIFLFSFYTILHFVVNKLGKWYFKFAFQADRKKDVELSLLWKKICAWRDQVALERAGTSGTSVVTESVTQTE
ncbi:hypothetical protein HDU99_001429, partial [Rhizoclosmatium hyalinum]